MERIELTDEQWGEVKGLCRVKFGAQECADFIGVSKDTLERRIKDRYKITFSQFRNAQLAHTKRSLAKKCIELGLEGDRVLLIFALKNINKWSDNPDPFEDEEAILEFE